MAIEQSYELSFSNYVTYRVQQKAFRWYSKSLLLNSLCANPFLSTWGLSLGGLYIFWSTCVIWDRKIYKIIMETLLGNELEYFSLGTIIFTSPLSGEKGKWVQDLSLWRLHCLNLIVSTPTTPLSIYLFGYPNFQEASYFLWC